MRRFWKYFFRRLSERSTYIQLGQAAVAAYVMPAPWCWLVFGIAAAGVMTADGPMPGIEPQDDP